MYVLRLSFFSKKTKSFRAFKKHLGILRQAIVKEERPLNTNEINRNINKRYE